MSKKKSDNAVATKEPEKTALALPETSSGDMAVFEELTKGTEYLERLQLAQGQSKVVQKRKVQVGSFYIPSGDDDGEDLGESVDLLVLARRPKALDFSDREAIIENFEPQSAEFKRIQAESADKDSGCIYGITFLVFERTTGQFLEYFCSSKSTRQEARKLFPFLPRTQADVDRDLALAKEQGIKAEDIEGTRSPKPLTLTSDLVEKPKFSWYVPLTSSCSQPFSNVPPMPKLAGAMTAFLSRKSTEVVPQEEAGDDNAPKR